MLPKFLLVVIIIITFGCGPTIKTSADIKNKLSHHKTVAILPFEIVLENNLQKTGKFTADEKQELRRYMSMALQRHLYELLKYKQKRFPFTANIQSSDITDSLLSANKIGFAAVFANNKKDICRILGVDAVISSQATFGKKKRTDFNDLLYKGTLESSFAIYDSVNTDKLWQYNKTIGDNFLKDISNTNLPDAIPYSYNTPEDKYQNVLIQWIPNIDAVFQSFTADFPYKKR
jgi:hypothetical protein